MQNAVEISNIFNFEVSPRSLVFTVEMESLYDTYVQNFLGNLSVREFGKSVYICTRYDLVFRVLFFYTHCTHHQDSSQKQRTHQILVQLAIFPAVTQGWLSSSKQNLWR